jgi:DNA-binding beta-propeller fold protein YncE
MQYLKKEAQVTGGQYEFAADDAVRDVFYLTGGGNNVAVFNPNTQAFGSPLQSASISAGAVLQELVLTPDNSKLLVVDPKDQSVVVFDLAGGTSTAVNVRLASDPTGTQIQPITVLATANNRALVSVTPCVTSPVRQIDLTSLQVSGRPDAGFSCGTYVTYPEYGRASADGSKILFTGSSGLEFGLEPSGPEYIWNYNAASDTFAGPVIVADTPWVSGLGALDGDGGIAALAQGTLDQRLLPSVPVVQPGFDARLNKTGSLLYTTGTDGSHIAVSDTRNGRWQLQLVLQNTSSGNGAIIPIIGVPQPLSIDPSGSKILVALQNGVGYFQLAVVPLAVGTVTPATVSAGGVIQVRGSGFVAGLTATIGGKPAACSVLDSETLSCTAPNLVAGATAISLTNPDGQSYSFENALVVQ